jgi:hypothetical protein
MKYAAERLLLSLRFGARNQWFTNGHSEQGRKAKLWVVMHAE